jgi:2-polyprenyl-3-methyl-5-hydroxy-6-metoxy-1,4-benzoquinol methylase
VREHDIRPQHLMDEQAARFDRDRLWLLERRAEFVDVPCPACSHGQGSFEFEKRGFRYLSCPVCGTMYLSPRPTAAVLAEYHERSENYAFWAEHVFPASEHARREAIFRPRAERLATLVRSQGVRTGTLADVGAGFGTFCEEVAGLGLFERVVAVEPTPVLAAACRRRGLEVIEQPAESDALDDESFDVVTAFEVIEHLVEPRVLLERAARALRPGGLLVLTCPSAVGFDVALLRERSGTIDHEHLNYFTPASLPLLVESTGFATVEVETPGRLDAELVANAARAGELRLDGFLQQVLVDGWDELGGPFQDFLTAHRLSSHLWVAARRR